MSARDIVPINKSFGAFLQKNGGAIFRIWAPDASRVQLLIDGAVQDAVHSPDGWYECIAESARAGTEYQWKIDDSLVVPDPASRFNPGGPHQPSVVVDPDAFCWTSEWCGRPWSEAIIYELHVGTFTPEGTYAAAEKKLDYLAELGVTAIELMPLSTFSGSFGWGYDGVLPYAPFAGYGTPDQLKSFIQSAHARGLMVLLDVVYNHFGPDGSYLSNYARAFFTDKHKTPWGDAINFDAEHSEIVREFFIGNALYWLEQFQFDGLRFDAVHAIKDDSAVDVLDELAMRIRSTFPHSHKHLILENENNVGTRLPPAGKFDAQWNDDFHHALHVALTGEKNGYYGDYDRRPAELVARALTSGFVWQGAKRNTEGRRENLVEAPPQHLGAMVNYLSNHDQTGNRAFGERLHELVPVEARPLAIALSILTPATPMIFAGEEFGSVTPFLYFADYCGDLGEAVTKGRLNEFGQFARRADGKEAELPAPCSPETFEAAKLDWDYADGSTGLAMRGLVARLIALRKQYFVPIAGGLELGKHDYHMTGEHSFLLRWRYKTTVIELACNLSGSAVPSAETDRPWKGLADQRTMYSVGSIGTDWWSPWSAEWRMGTEK